MTDREMIRKEYNQKIMSQFPEGSVVRVIDPAVYFVSVANKVRDRLGEVTGHQVPTPNPIVTFHAIGRKKIHRMVFSGCPWRDIEVVTDAVEIRMWREGVAQALERQAKKRGVK